MPKLVLNKEELDAIQAMVFPFNIIPNKCFLSTDTDRIFLSVRLTNHEHFLHATVILINEKSELHSTLLGSKYTKALIKASTSVEALPGYETQKIEFDSEVTIQQVMKAVFKELNENVRQTHTQYLENLKEVNKSWLDQLQGFFVETGFTVFHELNGMYEKGLNAKRAKHCFGKDEFFFELDTLLGQKLYLMTVYLSKEGAGYPLFTKKITIESDFKELQNLIENCVYEVYP